MVAGVEVPAGTLVIISPWLLHRREQDWPEPERFDPERFLAPDGAAGGDYLPFGAGPRLCIGRDVALVQCVRILAELLRERRVSPPRRRARGPGRRPGHPAAPRRSPARSRPVHASSPSTGQVLTTRSAGTPHAAARAQP